MSMPLDFNDFPLIYSPYGDVQTINGRTLFSCASPLIAADIAFRLNRDHAAQCGGSPAWGLQPGGFERMLFVVGEEGRRQREREYHLSTPTNAESTSR